MELANGILKLLAMPYGIYHICGTGRTSWYGFAQEIFKQSHIQAKLTPSKTQDFPRPANRPFNSVMDNKKMCRNWESALHDYLELRNI